MFILDFLEFNFSMGYVLFLNLSLFFVYAYLFPDATFSAVFSFFRFKAKWLGIIEGIFYGLTIIGGLSALVNPSLMFTMLAMGIPAIPANSIAALISLLNFAIFVMGSKRNRFSPKDIKRRRTYAKKVKAASQVRIIAVLSVDGPRRMERIWSSVFVRNARAIMNTARSICLHMNTENRKLNNI